MLPEEFFEIVSGDPDELDVYLQLIQRDVPLGGCVARLHCHCLIMDGNGRVKPERLAEFMRNSIIDYAIPKSRLNDARARDAKFKSGSAVAALHHEAIGTFTDLANTGEGGEMLLFLLAERFLKVPQVLCKMDLKTDSHVHYHGADGVYATVNDDGLLKLYWGESKVYSEPVAAIRDCLRSLAPFLVEADHEGADRERDLILLSDKADLSDPKLTAAFRRYFDRTSPLSNRVEYCGIALVAFDAAFYPKDNEKGKAEDILTAANNEIKKWVENAEKRLCVEKLGKFDIQFFCVPVPSADRFRVSFLKALGIHK